ncbi:MAG: hypothetical protein AAGG72_01475 [Pseudomonadota bacterium]
MRSAEDYSPAEVLQFGQRAEAEGNFDYAARAYSYLSDCFPDTVEGQVASDGQRRIAQRMSGGARDLAANGDPSGAMGRPQPAARNKVHGVGANGANGADRAGAGPAAAAQRQAVNGPLADGAHGKAHTQSSAFASGSSTVNGSLSGAMPGAVAGRTSPAGYGASAGSQPHQLNGLNGGVPKVDHGDAVGQASPGLNARLVGMGNAGLEPSVPRQPEHGQPSYGQPAAQGQPQHAQATHGQPSHQQPPPGYPGHLQTGPASLGDGHAPDAQSLSQRHRLNVTHSPSQPPQHVTPLGPGHATHADGFAPPATALAQQAASASGSIVADELDPFDDDDALPRMVARGGASYLDADDVATPRYRAGRFIASALVVLGWIAVLVCLVTGALQLFEALAPVLAMVSINLLPGPGAYAVMIAVGVVLIFVGQLARAVFDNANATQQILQIEKIKARV